MFLAHRIWCFDLILNFHAEHFCSKIALIHKLLDTKEGLYLFYFFLLLNSFALSKAHRKCTACAL